MNPVSLGLMSAPYGNNISLKKTKQNIYFEAEFLCAAETCLSTKLSGLDFPELCICKTDRNLQQEELACFRKCHVPDLVHSLPAFVCLSL